jgi:hypothetical protein
MAGRTFVISFFFGVFAVDSWVRCRPSVDSIQWLLPAMRSHLLYSTALHDYSSIPATSMLVCLFCNEQHSKVLELITAFLLCYINIYRRLDPFYHRIEEMKIVL